MVEKVKLTPADISTYLEIRLSEWAVWCRQGNHTGLGYPAQSAFQLFREGRVINAQRGYKWAEEHAQAEETEGWVLLLSQIYPLEAEALRAYYAERQPKETLATRYGVAIRTIESRIRNAKLWLEGCLAGQSASKN